MGIRQNLMLMAASSMLIILIIGMNVPAEEATVTNPESVSGPSESGVVYTDTLELNVTNRVAVIEVKDFGTIKIELYDNMTPITTENFCQLVEQNFYDGILFHRCIDDFVAQTGDPNSRDDNNPYNDGMGGSGKTIPLEINYNATHVDGAVGMARSSEPDSASSQFYICDGPQHGLDDEQRMNDGNGHGYAVFGVVIEGLDVAKSIAAVQTWGLLRPALKDHPINDVEMTSVTIIPGEPIIREEEDDGKDKGKDDGWSVPGFEVGLVLSGCLIFLVFRRQRR